MTNKLRLLLLLSMALMSFSLGHAYYIYQINALDIILFVVGGLAWVVSAIGILRQKQTAGKAVFIKRWLAYLTVIGCALTIMVCVNVIAAYLDVRFDVTRFKTHTLSARTHEVIGALPKDVRIIAFYVGAPPKYLEDLLGEYSRIGQDRIKTEIVDPVANIGYASQFGQVINAQEKKVILLAGKERTEANFTQEPLSEEGLTNALLRVSQPSRRIYFLTGHGERRLDDKNNDGLSRFSQQLAENNLLTQTLMLGTARAIPDDCAVLVIAGPTQDIPDLEQDLIQNYMLAGGDVMFLIEHTVITTPDVPLTKEQLSLNPSLNAMLNKWGMGVKSDVVIDLVSHASGDVGAPATRNYMAHRRVTKDLDYTFYVRPRSLTILSQRRKGIKVAPFVLTQSEKKSWGETNRTLSIKFNAGEDTPGPVPIAMVAWEPKAPEDKSDTRIIVFSDADFISNAYIDYYSNAKMGYNCIHWLSELDYVPFMQDKKIEVPRLDLTSKQKRGVMIILFLFPLGIILSGILIWIRPG